MDALTRVTDALAAAGSSRKFNGNWQCPGPMHSNGDRNPSLHVAYNGRTVALKCHTGCDIREIVDALGLEMTDLFDESLEKKEPVYYRYLSGEGEVLFAKLRYEPKRFSIKHPNGGGWEDGIGDNPRVLYRLPELRAAVAKGETVWLVEGEKDCDKLASLGLTATTKYSTSEKWRPEYVQWLTGMKPGSSAPWRLQQH